MDSGSNDRESTFAEWSHSRTLHNLSQIKTCSENVIIGVIVLGYNTNDGDRWENDFTTLGKDIENIITAYNNIASRYGWRGL